MLRLRDHYRRAVVSCKSERFGEDQSEAVSSRDDRTAALVNSTVAVVVCIRHARDQSTF